MVDFLGRAFKRRWIRFWWVIDEEKIWPQTWLFYISMIFIGIYNLFFVVLPPEVMTDSLPGHWYTSFLIFCAGGPIVSLIGKALKGQWAYTGMWMQLTGDTAVWGVCTTYTAATFYTQWWGQGNIAGGFVMASAIGSFFFIIRGVRRILQSDQWEAVK